MLRSYSDVLVLALATVALTPAGAAVRPTEKVSTLVVYGNDPCPRGTGDEIVVCARQPEGERYRIPKQFRGHKYNDARDGSWAGTAKVLEMVGREGTPNSCSAVGTGGQTGCFQKFLAQARAERARDAADAAGQP